MGITWNLHGGTMGIAWNFHENTMGIARNLHGIFMQHYRNCIYKYSLYLEDTCSNRSTHTYTHTCTHTQRHTHRDTHTEIQTQRHLHLPRRVVTLQTVGTLTLYTDFLCFLIRNISTTSRRLRCIPR